jgi:hypothetical protein
MLPPYRWRDWSIPALLEAKAAQGAQVSLVLPAYNEAETVGGIVARVRADLIDGPGFADGPALIDEHHHQSLRDLGAMALELIAVTDRRAGVGGPVGEVAHLRQFFPGADGAELVTRSVSLLERPPAVSVPAYRERAR